MTNKPMDPGTAEFVERVALVCEKEDFARIAGRIFGLLLVSAEPLSLDELAKALDVSKASISQEARRCEALGVLERVSKSGDRRDYYRVPDELFVRTMEMRLARWKSFHEVVSTGRKSLKLRNPEVLARLDDFDAAFEHMSGALTKAIDDWRSKNAKARRSA